jgi:hypothetical protein
MEMDPVPVSNTLRLSKRDGIFFAVALLLHGALLLIPFKQLPSVQDLPRVLTLSLLASPEPKAATVTPPVPIPPQERTTPAANSASRHEPPPQDILPREPEQTEPEVPKDPVTTARLVDSASRLKWSFPKEKEQRQLGVHQAQEIPENWRPGISLEDNLFNGMTVPEKTEVVDQWLADDGSYNVVINTTWGETLCGRKQAWDPMNPMLEHLTLFRKCGGGGKRSFKMPDRFTKHLVD